jgi:DNA polymerase-3 subunit delta
MGESRSTPTAGGSRCATSADYHRRRVTADLKPAYLILGGDRPKIQRALQRLRARVGHEAAELLSARETSGEDAVAACNALGLFGGGRRLVLVEEVEHWKAADTKAVAAYLADPAPETVLALTGNVRPDSALAKACARSGDVLVYDVSKRALPAWVAEQFSRLGATADGEACRALVEVVGDDLEALATEVDKLATWAGGEPIGARDVQALAAGRGETPIFALTDAWGRRDVPGVLSACEALLERTERSRRDELARIAGAMASHVTRVRACQAFAAEGVRPRDAAAALKVHPFAAEKAFAQAASFTVDELRDAVVRLAQLDFALKGGSRLAADLELQRALVDITRAPEPAGAGHQR